MYREFYAALAQVLPVLLLALMWDSAYLQRLRQQSRPSRAVGPGGVWFWTKPRVRAYTLIVAAMVIASIGAAVLVLAGIAGDSKALRISLTASTALLLATLLTRISVDVIDATKSGTIPAGMFPSKQPAHDLIDRQQVEPSSTVLETRAEDMVAGGENADSTK